MTPSAQNERRAAAYPENPNAARRALTSIRARWTAPVGGRRCDPAPGVLCRCCAAICGRTTPADHSPAPRVEGRSARGSLSDGRVFPRELQKRSSPSAVSGADSVGGSSRKGSLGGQNELVFFRVEGVSYSDLPAVLADEQARRQLETLMEARFCLENLRFLQALDALQSENTPDGRQLRLQSLFEQWIGELAPGEVNLFVETTAGLLAAWQSRASDADPAQDETLQALLDQARTQVTRLIQLGPLAELSSRLLDSPRRPSAALLEEVPADEAGRLLA